MLLISKGHLNRLLEAGEAASPEEACALLVGRLGPGPMRRVTRVELSPNIAEDRRHRFEVDPGLRIGLERELRGGPERLIGVWHSHPDESAEPSAVDLAHVYEPHLAWLVTAMAGRRPLLTQAWLPGEALGGFRPLPLRLLD